MIVDKNLTVDLNRVKPLKVIKIHEGDVNSVRLVLSITKNSESVDLSNVTIKYDAVLGNVLAEQDAVGSIDGSKAIIPITANMTAMGGILKVDVKFVEGNAVLYTQTITMLVERSVIDGDIIIDASGATINQKLHEINVRIDGLANTVYTKTQIEQLLNGKENFEYHQGITMADLDNYTDTSTIYRFYLDGSYHLLICTSPTGCQYRFTRFGEIYLRVYDIGQNAWGEWKKIETLTTSEVTAIVTAQLANYYTKTEMTQLLSGKADSATTLSGYGITNAYTKDETTQLLNGKANKATTLSGYGITNAYTKNETTQLLSGKADSATTLAGYGITDAYKKSEVDSLLSGKVKFEYHNSVALEDCDNYTAWDTIYHLYINGSYQMLMNSSVNGCQYRFTREGKIYYRNYNTGSSTWSNWSSILVNIPNGTITTEMLGHFLLPYENLSEDYIRYFDIISPSEFDALFDYGIYTGVSDSAWTSHYQAIGHFILLVVDENQLLMFPECSKVFARTRPVNGDWADWHDISPLNETQATTIAENVADGKLASYYTKTEMNTKLLEKMNIVVKTNATLADCDNCFAGDTVYRLIISGHEHLIINAGAHGTQFRFVEGDVFYRSYNNNAWDEWKHILTRIPNDTITEDMIQAEAVGPEQLKEIYMKAVADESVGDIDSWSRGVYTGTLGDNWRARYGYDGRYILIADELQLLFVPEHNLMRYRYRTVARQWSDWESIDLATLSDVHNAVYGESGEIGQNYAWYTDQSQGYSLTGTYNVSGNYCVLHGTAPLIAGWERVYYSLPVAALASSTTIALCENNAFTVATGTLNNVSVLEIKQLGSTSMQSGSIKFTLIYKYQD